MDDLINFMTYRGYRENSPRGVISKNIPNRMPDPNIPMSDWTSEMGMARNVLLEALQNAANQGLIEAQPENVISNEEWSQRQREHAQSPKLPVSLTPAGNIGGDIVPQYGSTDMNFWKQQGPKTKESLKEYLSPLNNFNVSTSNMLKNRNMLEDILGNNYANVFNQAQKSEAMENLYTQKDNRRMELEQYKILMKANKPDKISDIHKGINLAENQLKKYRLFKSIPEGVNIQDWLGEIVGGNSLNPITRSQQLGASTRDLLSLAQSGKDKKQMLIEEQAWLDFLNQMKQKIGIQQDISSSPTQQEPGQQQPTLPGNNISSPGLTPKEIDAINSTGAKSYDDLVNILKSRGKKIDDPEMIEKIKRYFVRS